MECEGVAYHEDEGSGDRTTDRHRKDCDEGVLRNVDVGKWVIRSLSTRALSSFNFIIASSGEGDRLNISGSTPGLEGGCCNCPIYSVTDVVSMSGTEKVPETTTYIQVLQKVIKSHQKYPKFLTTTQKTATA